LANPRTDLKVGHYKNKSGLGSGTVLPRWGPAVLVPYKTKKGDPRPTRKFGEWGTQTQEKNKTKKKQPEKKPQGSKTRPALHRRPYYYEAGFATRQ
jgi:hypothetical protein